MISRSLFLIFALSTSACTSGGEAPLLSSVWSQIKASRSDASAEPIGKKTPSRAQIKKLNLALIQINLEGEDVWPILTPAVKNGPFVTYGNKSRQLVTTRESQITGIRGHGTDMISAQSQPDDPLRTLTPPGQWPETMTREYRFAGDGPEGRIERYSCSIKRAGPAQIEIAGTSFDVIGFAETCSGTSGQFTNLYAADARTGRVWQSQQFIGHNMPPMNLDVLEPLTE